MKKQLFVSQKIILGIAILFLISFVNSIITNVDKVKTIYTAIPTLIIIYIVLFLIWRRIEKKRIGQHEESKRKNRNATIIITIVVLIIGIQIISMGVRDYQVIHKDSIVPIYEQFELTEEQYLSVKEIFDKCDFSEITKVEKDGIDKNGITSFYIEMKGVEPNKIIAPGKTEGNIIYVYFDEEKRIDEISVNFSPIYKNGKVLNPVRAFTRLSLNETTECQFICEKQIKQLLKAPSTAKFCDYLDYQWSKENKIIYAKGYVDSQNSFGAMLRTSYILEYNCVTEKPLSLIVDNQKFTFE